VASIGAAFARSNDPDELANRIGVTRQTVIAIDQGRSSPSSEVAFQLAGAFGVPLEVVFQQPGDAR
jgi:putative transcriptional regulator